MSFPPPVATDDDLVRWQWYIETQNGIQKELKSINRTLAKLDKRVAILEEHKNSDKNDALINAIEKLSTQMTSQRKTISPSKSSNIWVANVDWLKLAKGLAFFVIAIATFAAGLGVMKFFQ